MPHRPSTTLPRQRATGGLCLLLALAAALGACTSADPSAAQATPSTATIPLQDVPAGPGPSPTEGGDGDALAWAGAYCGAVTGWAADLAAEVTTLEDAVPSAGLIDEPRTLALQFVEGVTERTDELAAAVDGLGPAPVADGAGITAGLVADVQEARAALQAARGDIEDAEPDERDALLAALDGLDATYEEAIGALEGSLVQVGPKGGPLQTALDASPACRALTTSGGGPITTPPSELGDG